MATTDTNPNRCIIMSRDQIDTIIAGLKLLPKDSGNCDGLDTTIPAHLIELFETARDGASDGQYAFVL